ncbi:MAG: alpha-amylase family glycosyl hydrolase [Rubrivivax sp.]|nr:alpha-amylase family glycosyl hydrolase [Rubrivivax sp.]
MKSFVVAAAAAFSITAFAQTAMNHANATDLALAGTFEAREQDWRNGAIVYQVLVDRFAPAADLQAKRTLYPAPKVLRPWSELPQRGRYLEGAQVWSHEIDFWGGDLHSLQGKLDYVQQLGADVLYLNPIHLATTHHKYDALDYQQVSPEYGTRDDVRKLATELHRRGMKLVLDGVFNHMGRNAPIFQAAQAEYAAEQAPAGGGRAAAGGPSYRDWFVFGPQYAGGARTWALAQNLPELNLENAQVREYLYGGRDSVVRSWLRDGIDGWRLDVAFDIGFRFLDELTRAAHAEKPGSLVIGEIANYPREWYPSVDAVLHFTLRQILLGTAAGRIPAPTAGRMINRMTEDAGIENMLKSWVYLDNHDTERLATALPDERQRHLAQVLQFTLPGAPNLYYGSELDMTGGDDPEMRAPMRWDWVRDDPEPGSAQAWTKKLVQMRRHHRALRVGNFRLAEATKLLAFERYTDRAADTVIVLVNPSTTAVSETVLLTNSKLMDGTPMVDMLGKPGGEPIQISSSLLHVAVAPQGFLVLRPDVATRGGYTKYKRVQ